jgi:5-methylphenazine-1-carboxylate 1-monooxygenase
MAHAAAGARRRRRSDPVMVVGGGIGGLTAALALHARGFRVRVFETARSVRPLGVGINLLPHSVRVLTDLGLGDALRAAAIETAELVYVNKLGQRIWGEPRGLAAGYPVPQFSIHRGELQLLLLRAARRTLGASAVITGSRLESFEPRATGVRCTFADRRRNETAVEIDGAALIGADGIHSTVRRQLYPDEGPPHFAGRMLWRAATESEPFLGGRTMVMAGHANQKFVCYPISRADFERGRSLTNWIAELRVEHDSPPRQDWSREVDRAIFAPAFERWRFDWLDVPGLIAGAERVFEYPMTDRDPLPRWSFGAVTLLGDAAHPMYPIGSNGASQAILDAEALAERLASGGAIDEALAGYEADRREATGAIVLANRENGPEQVMQLAEERAPGGFERITDVIPRTELEEIAARYKRTAGFSPEQVRRAGLGGSAGTGA